MAVKAVVIGSGFSGLSSASFLAKKGYEVTVVEKNSTPGGRARILNAHGFTFDMGPSWYWMPDVFQRYFEKFGHKETDFYNLVRLDPSYRVFWGKDDFWDIPATLQDLKQLFEKEETGSSIILERFLAEAKYKYQVGMNDLVFKPGKSITEFFDKRVLMGIFDLHLFTSFQKYINHQFKSPRIRQLLEFPVLFLGAKPQDTPALYSLMNYADIQLGTWYPMGGMYEVVKGMVKVADSQGVRFTFDTTVKSIVNHNKTCKFIETDKGSIEADVIVSSADYHHTDSKLIKPGYNNYDKNYWEKRTMAPSCILYYIGVNKRLNNLRHHNLFFDQEFKRHSEEIYDDPKWPKNPLFYVCCPSVTDTSVAPEGMENLFLLIPVASGLSDNSEVKDHYFDLLMERLETITGQEIRKHVIFKQSYAQSNFIKDYNSFKGNAYGLANTLFQTSIFKPSLKNKHLENMYYTGQLTVPGPGVPPSLISGEVVASEIFKDFKTM